MYLLNEEDSKVQVKDELISLGFVGSLVKHGTQTVKKSKTKKQKEKSTKINGICHLDVYCYNLGNNSTFNEQNFKIAITCWPKLNVTTIIIILSVSLL